MSILDDILDAGERVFDTVLDFERGKIELKLLREAKALEAKREADTAPAGTFSGTATAGGFSTGQILLFGGLGLAAAFLVARLAR